MFLTFEGYFFYPITHLAVTQNPHAFNFPNHLAIPQWQILNINPIFVVITIVSMIAVLTNILHWLPMFDRVGNFIFFDVHVENLEICFLQIKESIDTVVEAHDVFPVVVMS